LTQEDYYYNFWQSDGKAPQRRQVDDDFLTAYAWAISQAKEHFTCTIKGFKYPCTPVKFEETL